MQKISPTILFAGPSLTDKSKALIQEKKIQLHAPVQRNDIYKIISSGSHQNIVIADGVFHQVVAVGHAEIRSAINKGYNVFGLSSMGAIRAFEMRHLGMQGYGKVYNWFFQLEDFQDDELAVFHFPAPSFKPITEPMVHFRECTKALVAKNQLTQGESEIIIKALKSKYYSERTIKYFKELLLKHTSLAPEKVIENFDTFRIKSQDLETFLEKEIWTKSPTTIL